MAIPKKVEKFLLQSKANYEIIQHKTVYTAFDKAQTLKAPLKTIGKTLLLKLDNKPAMVLIPANKILNKQKLKKIARAKKIDFLKEAWMKKNLKGIKVGAVPPFGVLFKIFGIRRIPKFLKPEQSEGGCSIPTFADRNLMNQPKIIINAGDYNFSIKISPSFFKKLVNPVRKDRVSGLSNGVKDLIIGSFSAPAK